MFSRPTARFSEQSSGKCDRFSGRRKRCFSSVPLTFCALNLLAALITSPVWREKTLECCVPLGVGLRQTGNSRERIKSRVETDDLANSILFHHREMYSVASRQSPISQNNLFRTFYCPTIHNEHLIDNP